LIATWYKNLENRSLITGTNKLPIPLVAFTGTGTTTLTNSHAIGLAAEITVIRACMCFTGKTQAQYPERGNNQFAGSYKEITSIHLCRLVY
jgi:hypothetical protein